MVIDSSAVMAILMGEPEAVAMARLIDGAPSRLMSSINVLETHMVSWGRKGDDGVRLFDDFLTRAQIEITPIDLRQTSAARSAFNRFGKGRHAAGLNLADCFAYALSKTSGEPLLFKGADFAKTDVLVANLA
jgi:ribonuclease VapC